MTVTLTILGCGSSAGVPRPALGWGACDPNNPKNRRRRCSLLVERTGAHGTTRIVIDTSPDLREQLIDAEVDHIDSVFLTHEHADQTHGIVRSSCTSAGAFRSISISRPPKTSWRGSPIASSRRRAATTRRS
jgi:ribonuclease BN (tRNA processing enzyme)